MTSRIKGYPFEVIASHDPPSVVLADRIKSVDWRERGAGYKGRMSSGVLSEVKAKLKALLLT